MRGLRYLGGAALAVAAAVGSGIGPAHPSIAATPITIGALYPLSGSQAGGGSEEYDGLRTAAQLVNAAGGVNGRQIRFVTENAPSIDAAPSAVDTLASKGVKVV